MIGAHTDALIVVVAVLFAAFVGLMIKRLAQRQLQCEYNLTIAPSDDVFQFRTPSANLPAGGGGS